MQLVAAPKYAQREGDVAPLEEHVVCTQLEEEEEDSRMLSSTHSSPTLSSSTPSLPTLHSDPHHHHVVPSGTSTYDIPGNTRKRKCDEEEGENDNNNEARVRRYLQLRRRLLSQRKLIRAGQTGVKLPLCYVYGDLLFLLPQLNALGNGGQGRGRRKSPMPDLSTPIDSSHHLEASSQVHRPKTPPLYYVQDSVGSQSLEEGGFSQEWFAKVLQDVIRDLNMFGVCVVDDFLGAERADRILGEVQSLHSRGVFQAGQVVSRHVQDQARGKIRGDKITWVTGSEPQCSAIGQLVSVVDSLVAKANQHHDAGTLAQYNITWRTRAMVACYPGCDTHYVKHVDNPNGDGRCITAIYYLNKHWTTADGGVLRIYPENYPDKIAAINPCFDRMLFFWSDRRNPHEVLPAKITRYAITVWYLDQKEREEYLARERDRMTDSSCT